MQEIIINKNIPEDNGDSYEGFYLQYHEIILRYLLKKCSSREDAEDLTNQSFMYCYQNWGKYDKTKASIETWLFLVVRSRWINYCKAKRYFVDISTLENILEGDDLIENAIQLSALRDELADALEQLPERYRTVLVLKYFKNMSDEEIAQKMCLSTGNVRVLSHRALQKMRLFIEKE